MGVGLIGLDVEACSNVADISIQKQTRCRLNAMAALGIAHFGPAALGLLQRVKAATAPAAGVAGSKRK